MRIRGAFGHHGQAARAGRHVNKDPVMYHVDIQCQAVCGPGHQWEAHRRRNTGPVEMNGNDANVAGLVTVGADAHGAQPFLAGQCIHIIPAQAYLE